MKKTNSGKIKKMIRRLVALFLVWTLYMPNNISQYIGTAPMEASANYDANPFVDSKNEFISYSSDSERTAEVKFDTNTLQLNNLVVSSFNCVATNTNFVEVEEDEVNKVIRLTPKDNDVYGYTDIIVNYVLQYITDPTKTEGHSIRIFYYYKKLVYAPALTYDPNKEDEIPIYDGTVKTGAETLADTSDYRAYNNTGTDAKEYTARFELQGQYKVWYDTQRSTTPYTINWKIKPSDVERSAPKKGDISTVPCITGAKDGKIKIKRAKNLPESAWIPEYKSNDGSDEDWDEMTEIDTDEDGDEYYIATVDAGKYDVRYAGDPTDKNYLYASAYTSVTVERYQPSGELKLTADGKEVTISDIGRAESEYGKTLRVSYQPDSDADTLKVTEYYFEWRSNNNEIVSGTQYVVKAPDVGGAVSVEMKATGGNDNILTNIRKKYVEISINKKQSDVIGNLSKTDIKKYVDGSVENGKITISDYDANRTYLYRLSTDANWSELSAGVNVFEVEKEGVYQVKTAATEIEDESAIKEIEVDTFYEIGFYGNGDEDDPVTNVPAAKSVLVDKDGKTANQKAYTGPSKNPTRNSSHYRFMGWYKEDAEEEFKFWGNSDSGADEDDVENPIELYAKWQYIPMDKATVTIKSPNNKRVEYGDTLTVSTSNIQFRNSDDKTLYYWWERNGELIGNHPVTSNEYKLGFDDIEKDGESVVIRCYVWTAGMLEDMSILDDVKYESDLTDTLDPSTGRKSSNSVSGVQRARLVLKYDDGGVKYASILNEEGQSKESISREYRYYTTEDGEKLPDSSADVILAVSAMQYNSKFEGDPEFILTADEGSAYYAVKRINSYVEDPYVGQKYVRLTADAFSTEWNVASYELEDYEYTPADVYEIIVTGLELPGEITPLDQTIIWKNDRDYTTPPALSLPRQITYSAKELLDMVIEDWDPGRVIENDYEFIKIEPYEASSDAGYEWNETDRKLTTQRLSGQKTVMKLTVDSAEALDEGGTYDYEYNPIEVYFTITTNNEGVQALSFDHVKIKELPDYEQTFTISVNGNMEINYIDAVNNSFKLFEDPATYSNSDLGETIDPEISIKDKISYTSSDTKIASISKNKEREVWVTIWDVGTVTITASIPYDGKYKNKQGEKAAATASYTLTITPTSMDEDYLPHFAMREAYKYLLVGENGGLLEPYTCSLTYIDPGVTQTGVYGGWREEDESLDDYEEIYKNYYTLPREGNYYTEGTNAGAYVAIAKLQTGYSWPTGSWVGVTFINENNCIDDIVIPWEILKAKFAADFTVTGESPYTDENTDGKLIIGNRNRSYGMEYNGDGAVSINWSSFTGNAVTGLVPGEYWVRYSGDSNHYASDAVSAVIYPTHKIVYYTRVSSFTGYAGRKYFDSDDLNNRVDMSQTDGQTIVVYWPENLLLQEPEVVSMPEDWYYASPSGWIIEEETEDEDVPSHWRFDEDYADRNYTLNADWQAIDYNIIYYDWNLNEFDVVGNPDTYNIESGAITFNEPYRSGYKFMGWTSEELGITTPTTSITFDPVEFSSTGTLRQIKLYTYWRVRAAMPVADPAGGRYTTTFNVELTCATPGAVIYYTVDGSEPDQNKRLYVGSIPVNKTLTIKAIAYADDMAESEIMIAEYIIVAPGNASGVTGIIVQPVRMSLIASSTNQRIEAELIPANAEHGNLIWTSANTKIVQVTPRAEEGSLVADLTPVKAGTTTITVREENSGAEGKFTVIVAKRGSSAWVPTQAIKISATTLSMRQGGTTKLTFTPVPSNATDYIASWESSDESVATVAADGTVKAVGQGKATIKLEATTYGYPELIGKQECVVTVDGSSLVQGITVQPSELELAAPLGSSSVGESAQLIATVYPDDAEDRTILWSADKPGYVTITADGVVTALREGEVFITASSADGATDEDGNPVSATIRARITQAVAAEDLADYKRRHNDNEPGDELWIGSIGTLTYTGSAITPAPNVYYGAKKLEYGEDYTLTYKNNVNAASADDYLAPAVTATLTGSYTGSAERTFAIDRADISKAEICNPSGFIKSGMEMKLLRPTIIWQGKTLKLNRDYTLEYTDGRSNAYFDAGVWDINVKGNGNFTGSVTAHEVLTFKDSAKNLARASAASLASAVSLIYDGTEKKPQYQLSGVDMSKVQVAYKNNVNAGKATVIFTSNSTDYYGKKKVTFKIKKCNIASAATQTTVDGMPEGYYNVAYVKGGVKPEIGLTVTGVTKAFTDTQTASVFATASGTQTVSGLQVLVKDRDFKVKYKNYTSPRMAGVAVVKGKGNYTGTLRVGYTIYRQDISNLYIIIDDVNYSKKARGYRKVSITVRDVNGKKLKKNKDYKIPADSWSAENETPSANSTVGLTITGVGTYTGSVRASYRVITKSQRIKNTEVSFRKYENGGWVPYTAENFYMTYNGGATVLTNQNIVLANGDETIPSASLEVVGFKDNTKAGTATAYVKALGTKYGGLKEVQFTIAKK